MQINLKAIALSSFALCATAALAANQARVDVPFSFTAEGHSFPAGAYNVAMDANNNIVTMESKTDASKRFSWNVGPAEAAKTAAVVKFDHIGADYALKSIQVGEHVTPVLDKDIQNTVSATTSISGQ